MLLVLIIPFFAFSQMNEVPLGQLDLNMKPYGVSVVKPYVVEGIKGTPFLYEEYYPATIYIKSKSIRLDSVRLNLLNNSIEFVSNGKAKAISGTKLDKIIIHVYGLKDGKVIYNGSCFKIENTISTGFYELLGETSRFKVLSKHSAKMKKPQYVAVLDAGSRKPEIKQISNNYILSDSTTLYNAKNKKMILSNFPNHESELKKFISTENISLKETQDLLRLLKYYEEISTKK